MASSEVTAKPRGKAAAKTTAQAIAPAPTPGFSYIAAGLQERADYIARLAPSTILPTAYRGNAANAFVAAETGAALGLEPLQALASIAVINGRATLSSDLMAAVIRRAGHTLRIVENSPESVTATLIRADDKKFEFTVTWDREKATKAGLWGQRGPWSQYPTQMLRARAITEVARQGASEALMGMIYSPEDFGATITDTGEVIEAEVVDEIHATATSKPKPAQATRPAAAPAQPTPLDKPLTPAQASVAKGLQTLSFTQDAYTALCKRCLGQIVAVTALNDEQAATLHAELIAIYNSGRAQPAPEPAPEVEIVDDEQAPIFDYGDDTDPNGGAA
nr:MAG TPA: RecT protein [Caudoviricetes sp.]